MAHIEEDPSDVPHDDFHVRVAGRFWNEVTSIQLRGHYKSASNVANLLIAEALEARAAKAGQQKKDMAIKRTPKAQRQTVRQNAKASG